MSMKHSACLFLAMLSVGCAPMTRRGAVVMKIDDTVGHVSIGDTEASQGDQVTLYRNICHAEGKSSKCRKTLIGQGRVSEVLNRDYSVATFPQGTSIHEGDTVELNK